ncbi:uncharacterized protein LOC107725183 [Sinocyclocheilus rhinocerous]|uniref:uncharacterized protein LOC107725183 n=1 Tax=Sinocyclocheilus rhinocerous TaxID=307959 RepID=UPI0007B96475|nr:PREDICTED: uncharacterized protein LOC107725183 [Sinocyclocheilus rhinocerous]
MDFLDNFTTPSFTVTLPNTTVVNITSDGESESPTPPPSEHPQTNNYTTDDSLKTVSQSSTNNMIKSTTTSKETTYIIIFIIAVLCLSGVVVYYCLKKKSRKYSVDYHPKQEDAQIPLSTVDVEVFDTTSVKAYIIIFIIAVLCLSGVVVYYCLKKKSRKYSVDYHPKQEDAQIPLSTVDVEVFDTTSVKDMQTFTPVESTEPAPVKESEKPERGKESADVKQENQHNLSSTQVTENPKDKMEVLTVVDLTDGEPTISTKTSMESLDDVLNENNSNNTRVEVKGNGYDFTEISIDALLLK